MDDDQDVLEHTLLVVREVNVYKVPPRSTSGGYKCAEWLVSSKIWSGRLRVVSVRDVCEIRLEDSNSGELFATCHVHPGQREASVQSAVDSSRYFVLKIDDGRGRHAFIGLGFNERNEAFDFNVALTDHEKHVMNARTKPVEAPESGGSGASHGSAGASPDFRLKEGETIKIQMKAKPPGEKKISLSSGSSQGMLKPLAPPPGGGIRLAPPPGSSISLATPLGSLAPPPSIGMSLAAPASSAPAPLTGQSKVPSTINSSNTSAAGWTSF